MSCVDFFVSDWVLEWNPPESSLWFDSFHESVAATLYKSFASHSRPFFCCGGWLPNPRKLAHAFRNIGLWNNKESLMMRCLKRCTSSNKPVNSPWSSEKPNPVLLEGLAVCFQRRKWWILQMNKTPQNCWILGPIWRYLIFGTWWKFNSKFWMYGTNGVETGEFGKGILRATYPPTEVCS